MIAFLSGCVPSATGGSVFQQANAEADTVSYQPVNYTNKAQKGPTLIVLPGQIKSSNATFLQKISSNNIADFAELELGNANFTVLERFDLGPMINEINLAVNMGDKTALEKFKRGKFKSTKWFVRFDILKAEQVSTAASGFSGKTVGNVFDAVVGGVGGNVGETVLSSTQSGGSAGIWLVGLRYKIIDASTSEQVTTGYVEKKMDTGKKAISLLGVSGAAEKMITLDTIVHRLVQEAVADIDMKK
ncbi:MAG: hypothetical protein FP814_10415 [Desulfobacterium sp.]|nr:hypothetical protein [Desulfobacterium sp.]